MINFHYNSQHIFLSLTLQEEIQERPQITTLISSLANYSNTIPAPTDPDAKPAPASARMGKLIRFPKCKKKKKTKGGKPSFKPINQKASGDGGDSTVKGRSTHTCTRGHTDNEMRCSVYVCTRVSVSLPPRVTDKQEERKKLNLHLLIFYSRSVNVVGHF